MAEKKTHVCIPATLEPEPPTELRGLSIGDSMGENALSIFASSNLAPVC